MREDRPGIPLRFAKGGEKLCKFTTETARFYSFSKLRSAGRGEGCGVWLEKRERRMGKKVKGWKGSKKEDFFSFAGVGDGHYEGRTELHWGCL